jgi:hypothetical protein
MAQGIPATVATAEPSARAGSKNRYPYGKLKIGARLRCALRLFALLMILGATVAVWQFGRVEALARRSYEAEQRSLLVMRVHLDVATFRETLASLADAQDHREFARQATSLRDAFLKDAARAQGAFSLVPDAEQDPTIQTRLETVPGALPAQIDSILELVKAEDWQALRLRLANEVQFLVGSSSSLVEDVDREVAQERAQAMERARSELFLVLPVTARLILLTSAMLGWYTTGQLADRSRACTPGRRHSHKVNFSMRLR